VKMRSSFDTDKLRQYKEPLGFLALIAATCVIAWFLPDQYNRNMAVGILAMGTLFDLLSLFYHVMTLLTGKYMSGFPLVGLVFYIWFLLASRFPLMSWEETELGSLWLFKLVDGALLFGFHALCQLPMFLQKPRSEYK
jgi:hypothetical protein